MGICHGHGRFLCYVGYGHLCGDEGEMAEQDSKPAPVYPMFPGAVRKFSWWDLDGKEPHTKVVEDKPTGYYIVLAFLGNYVYVISEGHVDDDRD